MSKIHLELLDKTRQQTFHHLSAFTKWGYLGGGTALALQINHRISEDFDIFVHKQINNALKIQIRNIFGNVNFSINSTDQLNFETDERIHITFLWYYYPPLFPFLKTSGLPLASIADISADKAQTLGRRAIWRDYVDLFFLLKGHLFTLEKIIFLAKKKFLGEFVEAQFLEQLSYFKDLRELPIYFVNNKYAPSEIKSFLIHQVQLYTKKHIVQ